MNVLALLIFSFLFAGCSLDASLENMMGITSQKLPVGVQIPTKTVTGVVSDPAKSDFLNTDILVGTHGVADGQSVLQFVIRLMNSDNTVVEGFTPEFSISKGTGVIKGTCSMSDSAGVSICSIRSTDSGVKTIKPENLATFAVEKDAVFDAPVKESTTIGSTGGDVGEASSPRGWRMMATVGTQYDKVIVQKNGYKLQVGPVGSVIE